MEFKKVNGKLEVNGQVLKSFYEKKSDKVWFHIPDELVSTLNRNLIGMKRDMFADAEEGHVWTVEPKEKPIDRSGHSTARKSAPEHWSNYLNEADKQLYAELEARGQEARKQAYEANSKQKKIEALRAQLAALEAEMAQM